MACNTLVPYTGTMPKSGGLTIEEEIVACTAYRNWHQSTYIPWLIANSPTICLASDLAGTLFDTTKYQGVHNNTLTYFLGESVSIGNDIYISNIDNNVATPPSSSWVQLPTLPDIATYSLTADTPISFTGIDSLVATWAIELSANGFTVTWDASVEWDGDGVEPEWTLGADLVYFYTLDGGTTIKGMQTRGGA